jgi:hypothetical protein
MLTRPLRPVDIVCCSVGVGDQLLDELFTFPLGLDPEIEKAIEDFTAMKKEREEKIRTLSDRAAQGIVYFIVLRKLIVISWLT